MLNRNKLKHIISLQKKKTREEEGLFIVEGDKIVKEFLGSHFKVVSLIAKPEFISALSAEQRDSCDEIIPVRYDELKKASSLKTPHNAMAVVKMAEQVKKPEILPGELVPALDFIQDPGNMGTIIRAAAWFGIRHIICSETCVDIYNPKVIQATMGAILNVEVTCTDLREYLSCARSGNVDIYGTLLEGVNIYESSLGKSGIIVLGNESRGISDDLLPFISHRITIPRFSTVSGGVESLNAGMAASIVFSEFLRR